ncbi:unnamed protein product [Phytomonas sp. Hart1]|nr:unnamed protein product [Phytomonas sp. Hart1]|eukprot:CCW70336.1 unnamed protein product [Phytomonas sp. isolate Hart1]
MPQDKRIIITKAVLYKLRRLCNDNSDEAAQIGIFVEFILPSVVVSQYPELQGTHPFSLVHRVYPKNGRSTCLIVPKAISTDCFKINKRHGYYDAVVTAESICRSGDMESMQRAGRVANTFSSFTVDSRIASKLPACIKHRVKTDAPGTVSSEASAADKARISIKYPEACLSTLDGLDEKENLTFRLSQSANSSRVYSTRQGHLLFRVGHGDMTAGDICENAKQFVFTLKKDYPTIWRYIHEFKLTSNKTDSIRFMEVHLPR